MDHRRPMQTEDDVDPLLLQPDSSFLRTIPEDRSDGVETNSAIVVGDFPLPSSVRSEASSTQAILEDNVTRPSKERIPQAPTSSDEEGRSSLSDTPAVLADNVASTSRSAPPTGRRSRGIVVPPPTGEEQPKRGIFLTWWDSLADIDWKSRKTICTLGLAVGLTLAVVVAIVLVVVLTDTKRPDDSSTQQPTLTPAPSTSFPTISPATETLLDNVIYNVSLDHTEFDNPESPESLARTWMIRQDLMVHDALDEGNYRTAQRYICTEFIYSLVPSENVSDYLLPDQEECDWPGFFCDDDLPGRVVTRILFPSAGLLGSLPYELGYLTSLQELGLPDNRIVGDIPDSFFNLTYGALRSLFWLDLGRNRLTGTLNTKIWSELSTLRFLYLEGNLLHGTIDPPPASALDDGRQRTEVSSIMEDIWLHENDFHGDFPDWILSTYKSSLTSISVAHNSLGGTLPDLDEWPPRLAEFSASNNSFVGNIPASLLYSAPAMEKIYLDKNELDGAVPSPGNNTVTSSIKNLYLHHNNLSGPLPDGFGSYWTQLRQLTLQENAITGSIGPSQCETWAATLTRLTADCPGDIECECCTKCYG